MNHVTICENPFIKETWKEFDTENVCDLLVTYFRGNWPKGARIYHKYVAQNCDVTPRDEASVLRFQDLKGNFYVLVFPEAPILIPILISIAIQAITFAITYLLRPSNNVKNQQQTSPNNQLTNRQNRERPGERIEDIYGQVWSTPTLIQVPYRVFKGNKEVEYAYMCVGRGEYEIAKVRDDLTPLEDIDGASAEFYSPNTSPNSGDAPFLRIGNQINEKIKKVKRYDSANGQVLVAPNKGVFKADNNVSFVSADSIITTGNIDFSDYFTLGSTTSPTHLTIANSLAKDPAGIHSSVNLDGTYEIADIVGNEIVLNNPSSVNSNWSALASFSGGASTNGSPTLTSSDSKWVGPFTINEPDVNEIWCNFVCPNGLYKLDKNANQFTMDVQIQIGIQAINSSGNPIGDEIFYFGTIQGSTEVRTLRGITVKCPLPLAGPCRVRTRRYSSTDLRDNWSVVDQTQWKDLYSVAPVSLTDFGNVTTVQTVTWPTQDALAIKSRKFNCLVSRKILKPSVTFNENATSVTLHVLAEGVLGTGGTGAYSKALINSTAVVGSPSALPVLPYSKQWFTLTQTGSFDISTLVANIGLWDTSNSDFPSPGPTVKIYDVYFTATFANGSTVKLRTTTVTDVLETSGSISGESNLLDTNESTSCDVEQLHFRSVTDYFNHVTCSDWVVVSTTGDVPVGWVLTGSPVKSANAADILVAMALDPYIGNRTSAELDFNGIYSAIGPGGANEEYFGTPLCSEFCFTFDDSKVSFEEMASDVATAAFSIAYRQGNVLSIFFEKQTSNSTMLFNHRNKLPGSEVRSVRFGTPSDFDGIQLDYIDPNSPNQPDVDATNTFYFPEDGSATAPKKISIPGVRNNVQAKLLGWRLYNKLLYQNITSEFSALQEAATCIRHERILIADNTRSDTQDGEVIDQSGLEITLSQDVILTVGHSYIVFLQHYDKTVESISITAGSASNKVVLGTTPTVPLVIDELKVRTFYQIVDTTSPSRSNAFLLEEKTPKDGMIYDLKANNYDDRYYSHDTDFINNILTENSNANFNSGYDGGGGGGGFTQVTTDVWVDGKCMPWDKTDNPSYAYGKDDGKQPMVVALGVSAGAIITIAADAPGDPSNVWFWSFATNTVRCSDSRDPVDASGTSIDPGYTAPVTGTTAGSSGLYFPTKYMTSSPLGLGGLCGAFAHVVAGKYIVDEPLSIGFGGNFTVPSGATHLLLGIDDDHFSDNQGGFQVHVTQLGASVSEPPIDDTVDPGTNQDYTIITVDGI